MGRFRIQFRPYGQGSCDCETPQGGAEHPKITKTMQMIATAKFQKSLKRAVGTKPYSQKVRELVAELAGSIGDVEHPLLRRPGRSG